MRGLSCARSHLMQKYEEVGLRLTCRNYIFLVNSLSSGMHIIVGFACFVFIILFSLLPCVFLFSICVTCSVARVKMHALLDKAC